MEAKGGQAHLSDVYHGVERPTGETLTKGKKAGLRKEIETHSSCSENYIQSYPDLFYSTHGIGSGWWGLRSKKS
jgi:hypothetical protein